MWVEVLGIGNELVHGRDSDADCTRWELVCYHSLASSILNYQYSIGRRYHGYRSGAYRVLDIGTRTGIWAIDFAEENPESQVLGTDLSPIQPMWLPPDAKFYIDDCESDWVQGDDEYFDFIHVRCLSGSVSDWNRLCRQAYAHLQPAGWRAANLSLWQNRCNEAAGQFKKEIRCADQLRQRMLDAGFVDVHEKIVKVPIGPWPKDPKMNEIGRYQREHMAMGIEPYTLGFIGKVLGWSEQECRVLIAKVVNEVRDKSMHMCIHFLFVCGRKRES
ncbi:S-adenosyl-L-methionine-dependent methyltransferase [Zopfia rhizophila CBS 207.26]|uniref:S-adenosyl-L-methionine-dependent methyltransferase n=1 Tax=Zopfia rhizophila CBS 207.26 TaxID=1314779 RepID=A0A6A6DV31_9PEZI|nr:S-adenosyl-L-methionine-dependent methyltransferase [Zopfia rhizophila CBS 207.26]